MDGLVQVQVTHLLQLAEGEQAGEVFQVGGAEGQGLFSQGLDEGRDVEGV